MRPRRWLLLSWMAMVASWSSGRGALSFPGTLAHHHHEGARFKEWFTRRLGVVPRSPHPWSGHPGAAGSIPATLLLFPCGPGHGIFPAGVSGICP